MVVKAAFVAGGFRHASARLIAGSVCCARCGDMNLSPETHQHLHPFVGPFVWCDSYWLTDEALSI